MAAVTSISSTFSSNGSAGSSPDDDSQPRTGGRVRTLEDIRRVPSDIEHRLGVLPQATAEQIQTLKLARKEILQFYTTLTDDSQINFLTGGTLPYVDPELWLELLEPHREHLADNPSIPKRFSEFVKLEGQEVLGRICRGIICASSLPLEVKLTFLAPDDAELRLYLLESQVRYAGVIDQEKFKRHLLDSANSPEKALWIRRGVLSVQQCSKGIENLKCVDTNSILELSPRTLASFPFEYFAHGSDGLDRRKVANIEERLALLPGDFIVPLARRIEMQDACKVEFSISPRTEALWSDACREGGIAVPFALRDLKALLISGPKGDEQKIERQIQTFLEWYIAQSIEKRTLTCKEIFSNFESETQASGGAGAILALTLTQDSLRSKFALMERYVVEWHQELVFNHLIQSGVEIAVPQDAGGISEIFDSCSKSLRPWLEQNQEAFLTLLIRELDKYRSEAKEKGNRALLMDIYAGVLFLKEYKPKECAKLLSEIIEFREYVDITSVYRAPERAAVRAAYNKVISLSKDEWSVKDESRLYDSSGLYWTVPAGDRWIFMEGLEAPKHEILSHACMLLQDTISKELRIDCTERNQKTDSLRSKIEKARVRLSDIDSTALSETEQIYHAALLPLFTHLSLWARGEKSDIRMIVEIESSGLARPADPTDKIKVAPGNHLDFIQKKYRVRELTYLSRECPVLDSERFKRNLLEMAKLSAKNLSRKVMSGYSPIIPEIPALKINPATLFRLSEALNGDNRYLATGFSSRMGDDYRYVPIQAGKVSDFLATIKEDVVRRQVTLSANLVGNGSILPRPHHSTIEPKTVSSMLEDISVEHHPDGSAFIQGAAGYAELSVGLQISIESPDLDYFRSYAEVQAALSPEIYQQLISPIAALDELPVALQQAIIEAREMPVVEAAYYLESFVRENYVYSFNAADSEYYLQFQKQRAAEIAHDHNAYLKMIHELADGRCLGKGVCGQLATVLFSALRLAGVPCLMTGGYLAAGEVVDENMEHAYVSAVLPGTNGAWRLKVLEAVGGGFEGLLFLQEKELQRLRSIQMGVSPDKGLLTDRETNKWGWLAAELGELTFDLTNQDADIFYARVMAYRGLQPNEPATAQGVADAYGALIGSFVDFSSQLERAFLDYPQIQTIIAIAAMRRAETIKTIEASIPSDFEIGD